LYEFLSNSLHNILNDLLNYILNVIMNDLPNYIMNNILHDILQPSSMLCIDSMGGELMCHKHKLWSVPKQ
jgi:hypothetical protein